MAKHLYAIVLYAVAWETELFRETDTYQNSEIHGKRLVVSFQKGMCSRISERLHEMLKKRQKAEERDLENPIFRSTGTSLVVVKQNKVEAELEKLGYRFKRSVSAGYYSPERSSYLQGMVAGNKVNFNRPINGKVSGLLK